MFYCRCLAGSSPSLFRLLGVVDGGSYVFENIDEAVVTLNLAVEFLQDLVERKGSYVVVVIEVGSLLAGIGHVKREFVVL